MSAAAARRLDLPSSNKGAGKLAVVKAKVLRPDRESGHQNPWKCAGLSRLASTRKTLGEELLQLQTLNASKLAKARKLGSCATHLKVLPDDWATQTASGR